MEVELPNGQIAEFPDDMPHDQIESVLQQHFSPKKATDESKQMAFEQIKKRFPNMPEGFINLLMPLAVEEAEQPQDTSQGTATGAFFRSAARTPLEGAENLASLIGLPTVKDASFPSLISEKESDKSHPFAELGGSLAGFLAPGAGSIAALRSIPAWGRIAERAAPSLLRRLPVLGAEGAALGAGFSPEGQRGEGALAGAALGAAGATLPTIGRGFGALKERLSSLRNLDRLKAEGKITEEQYQTAIADEDALKALSQKQGLGTDVTKMEAELPELTQQAEQLGQEIKEIPQVNIENMLGAPTGEELVPQAERLLKTAEQKSQELEKSISKGLGEGTAHDVRAAKDLSEMIKSKKSEIGNIYEDVKKDLKDTHVELPRGRDVKQVTQELNKAISEGGYKSEEVQNLAKELDSIKGNKNDLIPGEHFLAMYRSTRSLANKAMRNSRKTDIDAQDRMHWENQHKELTATADKMNDILKQHMGEESYNKLQEANHRWRTEITPLYKNKLYYQIIKEGRLPSDIINQLRGTGEGQDILRQMIKSNPETLKNVVGQRYAHQPKKLQQFDELSHEYIEQMPELKEQIAQHRQALQMKKAHEENLIRAKEKAKQMKSEAERVTKSFEEEKKTQMTRAKKEAELKELQTKISDSERNIQELKKKARATNISLQKKLELESKIAKAEKDKEKLKNRAMITVISLGTGALGIKLGSLISR